MQPPDFFFTVRLVEESDGAESPIIKVVYSRRWKTIEKTCRSGEVERQKLLPPAARENYPCCQIETVLVTETKKGLIVVFLEGGGEA